MKNAKGFIELAKEMAKESMLVGVGYGRRYEAQMLENIGMPDRVLDVDIMPPWAIDAGRD
jgi:hypothetical protein